MASSEDIPRAPSAPIQVEEPSNELRDQAESQLPSAEVQAEQIHNSRQISHPPEPEDGYDELMERKEYYKEKYRRYRKLSKEKEKDNINLQNKYESLLADYNNYHFRSEHDNRANASFLQGARELLDSFRVKDFFQARTGWSSDKTELKQTQEQLSILKDELKKTREQCSDVEDELKETRAQFFKLQNEVLDCVERFDPSFDSQVFQGFVQLNNSIGKLSKSKDLKEIALQGNPLLDWCPSALWENSFNPTLMNDGPSDTEKRLLLRQAIWKLISEALLDRARPFASFGGPISELASGFYFDRLFPDYEFDENAGKWRSITVRQLAALQGADSNGHNKENFVTELINGFIIYIQRKLVRDPIDLEQLAGRLNGGVLTKRLREVFEKAIEFSQLIMKERASFTVDSPRLDEIDYIRVEGDGITTAQGVAVGVSDGHDTEVDLVGTIKLVGSPFLRKHGDGGGKNLDQDMIIVRAFVLIDLGDIPFSEKLSETPVIVE